MRNSAARSAIPVSTSTTVLGQADDAFRTGQYAVTNLLYYPVKDVMVGAEFQFGHRKNFRDGFSVPDYRIQFSFKYNFSFQVLGN